MTDKLATDVAPATPATPKKQTAAKAKKPRVKPTHPPASEMVLTAIQTLKERSGSSLQAIKKYILITYKVDVEKQAIFIKKYLKTAVEQKVSIQTKGKGASGSFKLNVAKAEGKITKPKTSEAKPASKKPAADKKPKAVSSSKKAVAKKPAAAKKPAVRKAAAKKPAAAKPAIAKKSMAKKSAKSPASKPKAPKPKRTTTKRSTPKKK